MIRNIILVDLDNTLCVDTHRRHLIDISWDAYHSELGNDEPAMDLALLLAACARNGFLLVALTGRNEKWRNLTSRWLIERMIKIDELYMRPDDNYDKTVVVKEKLLQQHLGAEWPERIIGAFEDNDEICTMLASKGVTVFQVFNRRY